MSYCPHCMRPASGKFCRKCGGESDHVAKPDQLAVGTLLNGTQGRTYQLGAVRGQGGFGMTYAARELNSGQRVAIKEYFPSYCAMRSNTSQVTPKDGRKEAFREGKEAFLQEAAVLNTVGSLSSVVTILDYFEAKGTLYLVMEFVEGKSLREMVEENGRISAQKFLPLMTELFRDLQILHKANMIHRDISPDNLILMPDGKLKLLDFGSARRLDLNKELTMLLKAGFSPMEQYQSRGQGPWTDVYALGATIYYCLTGKIPPTAVDRLSKDTLKPPTEYGARLSREQEKALLHAMAVQVSERTPDMETFHAQLYTGAEVKPSKGSNWKRPACLGAAAVLVFACAVTGTVLWEKSKKTTEENVQKQTVIEQQKQEKAPAKPAAVVYEQTGETSDGFQYGVADDERSCTIIGYHGSMAELVIPDKIESMSVIAIAEGAFADSSVVHELQLCDGVRVQSGAFRNCKSLNSVTIGINCILEADAFAGCSSLDIVSAMDNCTLDAEAFSDCVALRCGTYMDENHFEQMQLPTEFQAYQSEMQTKLGKLDHVKIVDDIVYGCTYNGQWIVLDLPDDATQIQVDESVLWIENEALEGINESAKITIGADTMLSYESYLLTQWQAPYGSAADCWLQSCEVCRRVNEKLEGRTVLPDETLLRAAMIRVEEMDAQSKHFVRPDNSHWSTVLEEVGMTAVGDCNEAKGIADGKLDKNYDKLADNFSGVLKNKEANGAYVSHLAVARRYTSSDGWYLCAIGIAK